MLVELSAHRGAGLLACHAHQRIVSYVIPVRSFRASEALSALPLLGAIPVIGFAAKHVTLWNVYLVLNSYGWLRVYRHFLRATKNFPEAYRPNLKDEIILRNSLKEAIRFPSRAVNVLENSHVSRFLQTYIEQNRPKIPYGTDAAIYAATKTIVSKLFPLVGKIETVVKHAKK